MYKNFIKRVIDFILSFAGIIIAAIPMAVFALIIVTEDPGPVIFRQRRIGERKREFYILKFRSMKLNAPKDVPTHLMVHPEKYVLKCGRWMRRMSIDELPQLFNILKGDMSIVGPRPALWNQFDLIAERDKYGANDVKPGLTGWAQINGRDEIDIPDKARLDGEYVKKISFAFDIKCFFKTIKAVIKHDGFSETEADDNAGMSGNDFNLNKKINEQR